MGFCPYGLRFTHIFTRYCCPKSRRDESFLPGPKGPGLKARQPESPVRTTDFALGDSSPANLESVALTELSWLHIDIQGLAALAMGYNPYGIEEPPGKALQPGGCQPPGKAGVNLCVNRSPTGLAAKRDLLRSYFLQ